MVRPGMLPGLLEAAVDGTSGTPRRTARDWAVDVASVALAAAMASVALLVPDPQWPLPRAVSVMAAVAACGALFLRRRQPVLVTVVLVLASVVIPAVSGASMIALFTVAVHRRLPTVMGLVVLAVASAMMQFSLGFTIGRSSYWIAVGGTVLISLLVVGWGIAVRTRRDLVLLMAERMRRLRLEQESKVREARQAVREGIARDLHDSLAHRLSLITMSAGALQYRGSAPAPDVDDMVEILRTNARLGLSELRQVVTVLRRPDGRAVPGQHDPGALWDLVDEARASGQEVDVAWSVPVDTMKPGVRDSLYRCVQEGLSNARKHGADRQVTLRGRIEAEGAVRLDMINTVGGQGPAGGNGSGLAGLRERIGEHGGRMSTSVAEGAFRLQVSWPDAVPRDSSESREDNT